MQRASARPDDAGGWRLLGRVYFKRGVINEAHEAFKRAVTLDPMSVAAQFDLGRADLALGRPEEAASHFRRAIELAPDSAYSDQARGLLDQINDSGLVIQAGYEIRRFDGSQIPDIHKKLNEPVTPKTAPTWYDIRIETGVLYNSNVALTPLSRELSPVDFASSQGFLSPSLEISLIDRQTWRTGTTFNGEFNINEGGFREFNLQSYRPGLFFESFHFQGERMFVPRVAYEFTHDEFDGNAFGNRHALVTSLLASWNETQSTLVYWSIDYTDFLNDGILPSVTSQDGWTNAAGVSHDYLLNYRCFKLFRAGVDGTLADTRGSDYRFQGVSLFAEGVLKVTEDTELSLKAGWGYRDYSDFEFTPSRNENVWRASAELRKRLTENLSVAIVFNYDRFASRNPLFDAERYVSGVTTTFQY